MKYKFPGSIVDGRWVFSDRKRFDNLLRTIGNAEEKELVIQDVEKDRSDRQRKYYYGVIIEKTGAHFGYDKDDMSAVWAEMFLSYTIKGLDGQEKTVHKTPSQLNVKQTEEYHERIRRFCSTDHELYIPMPNEAEGEYDYH